MNAVWKRNWYTQESQGEIEMDPKDLIIANVKIVSVLLEVGDVSVIFGWLVEGKDMYFETTLSSPCVP